MACRDSYVMKTLSDGKIVAVRKDADQKTGKLVVNNESHQLMFGVDCKCSADVLLQNNLLMFEWVVRNKIYPHFWGRTLNGQTPLTLQEIRFLHNKGCKIAALFEAQETMETHQQGYLHGEQAGFAALLLQIPVGSAIFLELNESDNLTTDYLCGYAEAVLNLGYTPGVRANTDAAFGFDREFSRGMRVNQRLFEKMLIWADAPRLEEYDRMTTTHLIHPDNWKPFAPSGISRNEIALWSYGKECHPIHDDDDRLTTFNINLVRNDRVIIEKFF